MKPRKTPVRQPHSSETKEKMRQALVGRRYTKHGFHVGVRLNEAKKSATRRGIEWTLDDELAKDLIASDCRYCGTPSSPEIPFSSEKTGWSCRGVNGIDRLDNERGYSAENCVPCCGTCNYAKRTMAVSDFIVWIEKVRAHLSSHPF